MAKKTFTRKPREDEDDEDDVDEQALARLEALQRSRMMDMFGYDPEDDKQKDIVAEDTKPEHLEKEQEGKKKRKRGVVGGEGNKESGGGSVLAVVRQKDAQIVAGDAFTKNKQWDHQGSAKGESELAQFEKTHGASPKRKDAAASAGMSFISPTKTSAEEMEKERNLFMSSKASLVHLTTAQSEARKAGGSLRGRSRKKETQTFGSIAASVAELGASAFWGRKKKQWESEKLRLSGAKEPKRQKVPYNILMGQLSKEKEREAKRKLLQQQAGLAIKKVSKSVGTKKKTGKSFGSTGVLQVNPKQGGEDPRWSKAGKGFKKQKR